MAIMKASKTLVCLVGQSDVDFGMLKAKVRRPATNKPHHAVVIFPAPRALQLRPSRWVAGTRPCGTARTASEPSASMRKQCVKGLLSSEGHHLSLIHI